MVQKILQETLIPHWQTLKGYELQIELSHTFIYRSFNEIFEKKPEVADTTGN